jgi:hypothetical protein
MEKIKLTEKILLRMDKDLKAKVFESAIKNNRSLNSQILTVLQENIKINDRSI